MLLFLTVLLASTSIVLLVLYVRRGLKLSRYRSTIAQANRRIAAYGKREAQLIDLTRQTVRDMADVARSEVERAYSSSDQYDYDADLYDEVWHCRDFDQDPPEGYPVLVDKWVRVAGISYRADFASRFAIGENLSVEAVREPDNPHNPNAIAVYGRWFDYEYHGYYREQLGYLQSGFADRLAGVDIAITLAAVYPSIEPDKHAGVRVRVWQSEPTKTSKAEGILPRRDLGRTALSLFFPYSFPEPVETSENSESSEGI